MTSVPQDPNTAPDEMEQLEAERDKATAQWNREKGERVKAEDARDVAQRGRAVAENARDKAQQGRIQADEQRAEMELFLGILAHDLRNPLSAIRNSADLLIRRGPHPEGIMKGIARIAHSADRMTRMIGQMLDFTRIRSSGGMPIEIWPTDLVALCREAIGESEVSYPDSVLQLEAGRSVACDCDPDRLSQVLQNLIGNAIQYGQPGRPVTISVHQAGGQAVAAIHNEGPAIPPAILPHIFDPFRRGERPSATGLGLGMYIAQQIMFAHRGTIDIISTEESGTTVKVTLPVH